MVGELGELGEWSAMFLSLDRNMLVKEAMAYLRLGVAKGAHVIDIEMITWEQSERRYLFVHLNLLPMCFNIPAVRSLFFSCAAGCSDYRSVVAFRHHHGQDTLGSDSDLALVFWCSLGWRL